MGFRTAQVCTISRFHLGCNYTLPTVNYTRFLVLSRMQTLDLELKIPADLSGRASALVRIGLSEFGQSLSSLLRALDLPIAKIDRRPSDGLVPFLDFYFLEVRDEHDSRGAAWWHDKVASGIERVRALGGHAQILGEYVNRSAVS